MRKQSFLISVLFLLAAALPVYASSPDSFTCEFGNHLVLSHEEAWACNVILDPVPAGCQTNGAFSWQYTYCPGVLPSGYSCTGTAEAVSCTKKKSSSGATLQCVYVRDASGNVMGSSDGTRTFYNCTSDTALPSVGDECHRAYGTAPNENKYECSFPKTGGACNTPIKDASGKETGQVCTLAVAGDFPTPTVWFDPTVVDTNHQPVIFWGVADSESNPTSCKFGNNSLVPTKNYAFKGHYAATLPINDEVGEHTYNVTCTNSSGSGTGSAVLKVVLPFIQVSTSTCTGTSCNTDYKLLEPLPGLDTNIKDLSFAAMLGLAFKVMITLGALLAVGTLVYSGIAYMLSSSPLETMGEAKKRMQSALWGLLILLGAWLLLNTINPQLLVFDLTIPGSEAAGPNPSGVNAAVGEATEADIRACRPGIIVPKEGGGWDCVGDY